MKPQSLAAVVTVVGLFAGLMWWRQSSLEDEIHALRTALEQSHPDPLSTPVSSSVDQPAVASSSATAFTPRVEAMGNTDDRVTDLERTVNGQADVLEDLLARFALEDEKARKANARSWGPEQAIGSPDTMTAGDQRTAWAPASAEGGIQWLEAEFANPAEIAQVVVRQTSNPGCITKVVLLAEGGAEIPLWEGQDPSRGQALADTPFTPTGSLTGRRVKVYLDTSRLAGWEEIDAVQLVARDGTRQWAQNVTASSTYASGSNGGSTSNGLGWPNPDGGAATLLGAPSFNHNPPVNVWNLQSGNDAIIKGMTFSRRLYEN